MPWTNENFTSRHKSKKHYHDEIGMDQQKTGEAELFLGHYDTNQVEMFTSAHTKIMMFMGHRHSNQAGIFASAPY